MGWVESISEAISYIEDHITEDLTIERVARKALISPFYFQKGFALLCGFTVSEYIRNRRLTLAGNELSSSEIRIIDLAIKYGYDSPDSFTKAFIRFHGVTPTAVRKEGAMVKSFSSLKIKFKLEGGFIMDYKIVEKEAFDVVGVLRTFKYDDSKTEIPKFWSEIFQSGKKNILCGMYGVCIDESMGEGEFEYMIADDYDGTSEIPEGLEIKSIPAQKWALFACRGPMPHSIQDANKKIYSEWLPNCNEYEIAAGYNIEMYSDPAQFSEGMQDEQYYSEIWIPVIKK